MASALARAVACMFSGEGRCTRSGATGSPATRAGTWWARACRCPRSRNTRQGHRMSALLRSVLWLATLLFSAVAAAAPTVTYYHNDLAGSPVVASNAQGQVIWRESYRPYGERTRNEPAAADNKVWFTSRRQDAETGLVYMGARYYDPVIGRFISTDPSGFDEKNLHSFNRYAYANNNPLKYSDPDGKSPLIVWIARATGAGYGAGVMADAVSQYAAWGSFDWQMAMSSSAARAGAEAGLFSPAPGMGVGLAIERVTVPAVTDSK